jgi:hypothetical protein
MHKKAAYLNAITATVLLNMSRLIVHYSKIPI